MAVDTWKPPPLTEWKRDGASVVWIDRDALIIRTIANCMNEDQSKFIVDMAHERDPLLAALRGAVEALKVLDGAGCLVFAHLLEESNQNIHEILSELNTALKQTGAAILAVEEFLK